MRMLGWDDLKARGIPWTRQHIYRLIRKGEFPPPVKLGPQTNVWPEPTIDRFLNDRVAARNATATP
jgi:prophage regulatory protein